MFILKCNECNKMFKADKYENGFITDFGDKLHNCFCGGQLKGIETEEWVADKVFSCKGEKQK